MAADWLAAEHCYAAALREIEIRAAIVGAEVASIDSVVQPVTRFSQ